MTALTGKAPFQWTQIEQTAFNQMKALVTADALLHCPDHNHPFEIEMDVSDYQLGTVIKQHGCLVAYYSRKLTPAQQNYTTIKMNYCPLLKPFESSSHYFWVQNSMSTWITRISLMLSPVLPPNVSYVGIYFWRNMVLHSITKRVSPFYC